ncbi:MAG: hypothetical protein IJS32_09805 [Kiritimatiellae bacterium]|nr:hypothetical protein [Kiritimatiellia bacterium]
MKPARFLFFRLTAVVLLAGSFCLAADEVELAVTSAFDLQKAQASCATGTNHLARGRFREAKSFLDASAGVAGARLRELEIREKGLATLEESLATVRELRESPGREPEETLRRAEALRGPLLALLEAAGEETSHGLTSLRDGLRHAVACIAEFRHRLENGEDREANQALESLQGALEKELAALGPLRETAGAFRSVMAKTAQALEELERQRALPLDTARSLEFAREQLAQAQELIESPGEGRFIDAQLTRLPAARVYLDDVAATGLFPEERATLEKELAETWRRYWICGADWFLAQARKALETQEFPWISVDSDTACAKTEFFAHLAGDDPEKERIGREIAELERIAESLAP